MRFHRDGDDGVLIVAVLGEVGVGPSPESRIRLVEGIIGIDRRVAEGRGGKGCPNIGQKRLIVADEQGLQLGKAFLNQAGDLGLAGFMQRDLDARLVLVVAPTKHVIDRQHGLNVGQQVFDRQEVPHHHAHHGRAAKASTDDHLKPGLALCVLHHAKADVMRLGHRAVIRGAGDGDLELAGQELEFRMVGGPLAQKLGIGAGVFDFIGSRACEMIRCDVTHAVARGLDGVHLDIGQRGQDRRHIGQFRPVELDVLPGGEVAIALVPGVGNHGQLPHLMRADGAIRNGHAQHIGVQLQIKPVHQAQGAELLLGQGPVQTAGHLIGELRHASANEGFIEVGIAIHRRTLDRVIGLFAVVVVRRATGAEGLAEVGGFGAAWASLGIGEVGTHDHQLLRGGIEKAQLGMCLVFDELGLMVERRPAVIGGQVDHIAFAQTVGGDDFGGKAAHAVASFKAGMARTAARGARP